MSLLNQLERHLGRFAVPGLLRYVVMLNALVFVLAYLNPGYVQYLVLDRNAILSGQVWRLLSWIFVPTTSSMLFVFFYLMFTWFIGDLLESIWGTFRLNIYYVVGWLGCTAAALIFGLGLGNVVLSASLLFAAGTLVPNMTIMLFGVIPLAMKWSALITAALLVLSMLGAGPRAWLAVALALINYFLFFGPDLVRRSRERREIAARRAKFEVAKGPAETLHRCQTCGRTEVSNPELDFRVAGDGHEYCTQHLPARRD